MNKKRQALAKTSSKRDMGLPASSPERQVTTKDAIVIRETQDDHLAAPNSYVHFQEQPSTTGMGPPSHISAPRQVRDDVSQRSAMRSSFARKQRLPTDNPGGTPLSASQGQ